MNHHGLAPGSFDAVAVNEIDISAHAQTYVATLLIMQKPKISAEIAKMRWLPLQWEKQQGDCAIEDLLMECTNGVAT